MSSWVECLCGATIGTGAFPNPDVYRIVSEERYDEVDDPVDRNKLASLYLTGDVLIRCQKCERILIQRGGVSNFESFVKED